MKGIFLGIFLGVSLLVSGCTASKSASKGVAPDFSLFLERTPCKGNCPYFHVTVNAKGQVEYQGRNFTDKIGIYRKEIKKKNLTRLAALVDNYGFWDFEPMYDDPKIADLPGTMIVVTHHGKTHQVLYRSGMPDKLVEMCEEIESLIGDEGYTRIADIP